MRLSRYLEMLFLGEYTLTICTLEVWTRRRTVRHICHPVFYIAGCELAGLNESGDCGLHSPRSYYMSHNLGTTSRKEERFTGVGGTLWLGIYVRKQLRYKYVCYCTWEHLSTV